MTFDTPLVLSILQLIWINILLSGDNALVIALACRDLPAHQKKVGMVLGAAVAIGLRIVFTFLLTFLLDTPFLRICGALLLFWIAIKLLIDDEDTHTGKIVTSDRLINAVRTVAVADVVMSLDNVLAIAAIAKDNVVLLVTGLLISMPLIVAGSGLVMFMLNRFPILVWIGAALLGWVAGDMLLADPALLAIAGKASLQMLEIPFALAGAACVVLAGYFIARFRKGSQNA